MLTRILPLLWIALGNTIAIAQPPNSLPPKRAEEFQPNLRPTLEIRRLSGPIQIDGELNDPGWLAAGKATNFVETYPGDQTKPLVATEALIMFDEAHLYVAFIASDDPKFIRASLRDRDTIWDDDYVGILLDTYGDAAWTHEIYANPLGIQGDLRWTPKGDDTSFNLVFKAMGKITASGYQVEMAIPFSSLRFPNKPIQAWRVNFFRSHPRESRRTYMWATRDRNNPCFPCQFGTLTGIENVKSAGNVVLLPAVIGFQSGQLRNPQISTSGFENNNPDGEAGLGIQYAVTPSLTAELTYNPDFSHVESDAGQIDVNSTFALYYPERRPFFQEGSDLFETLPYNIFYTRSINDPLIAAKLIGRRNRTNLAYVAARDEHSPIIIPLEEQSGDLGAGRSFSNILRVKRTLLQDSYIGAILTDRRFDAGGSGTVAGTDATIRFLRNYRLKWQLMLSQTKELSDATLKGRFSYTQRTFERGAHTVAFDGESYGGSAVHASFERSARNWNFDFEYWGTSPEFRADNGFVNQNDNRRFTYWTYYYFYPNTKLVDYFLPSLGGGRWWNFAGMRNDNYVRPGMNFQFKAQTNIFVGYTFATARYRGIVFDGIRRLEVIVNSKFSKPVAVSFQLTEGRFIARRVFPPVLGKGGTNFTGSATIKPSQRLIIEPSFSFFDLNYPNGTAMFRSYILRSRFNYQFTRELFLRLVVQYSNDKLFYTTPQSFSQRLSIEPLLSYKLNPFTIFYIGSTHQYRDIDPLTNHLTQNSRQFFLKFQYLFRR
jgi:hypothetical protein